MCFCENRYDKNTEENKKKEIKTDLFSVATHDSRNCFVTSRRSPSKACRDIISNYLQDNFKTRQLRKILGVFLLILLTFSYE